MAASKWEKPVGDALATKLGAVTGMTGGAFNLAIDNLATRPAALVLIPEITLKGRSGSFDTWEAIYPFVVIPEILSTVDESAAALVDLQGGIRLAWWAGTQLGLQYVTESKLLHIKPDLFTLAGEEEPVLSGEVLVSVTEYDRRT